MCCLWKSWKGCPDRAVILTFFEENIDSPSNAEGVFFILCDPVGFLAIGTKNYAVRTLFIGQTFEPVISPIAQAYRSRMVGGSSLSGIGVKPSDV